MNKIDIKKELGIDSMVQELDNTIAKFKEAQCALRSLNKELEVFNKQRQSRLKKLVEWIKTKYNGIR